MNSKTTTNFITSNDKNNWQANRNFFLCCTRPPGTPLLALNKDGSVRSVGGCTDELKEPGFTHVAVGENQGIVFSRVMPTAAAAVDEGGEYGAGMKKKGSSKKLLRMFKAILFETSLAKKIKKRKRIKKQKQASKGTLSANPENSELFNGGSITQETMDTGSGRSSSSLGFSSNLSGTTSSTRSSSVSSNSKSSKSFSDLIKSLSDRTKSFSDRNKSLYDKTKALFDRNKSFRINTFERMKQNKQENMPMQESGKGRFGPNVGLCFLLMSLFVLVLWGKCCAIFCTATWLFLVPCWSTEKTPSQNLVIHSPHLDSTLRRRT